MVTKKAKNPTVKDYLKGLKGPQKNLVLKLRGTIRQAVPAIEEAIKWGNCLTFSVSGKNLIQTVVGKDKITLIFFQGIHLKDPQGLLEGEGRSVRSARFKGLDFNPAHLKALVRQAASL
jgi:hypothetical protein